MAETRPIGDILDQLGVQSDVEAEDLVSSAVVVLSVLVPGSDEPRLSIANSEGMSWIQQAGLLRLAERICSEPPNMADE